MSGCHVAVLAMRAQGTAVQTSALGPLAADGRVFRMAGAPWRWKGVSAFGLLNRFAKGDALSGYFAYWRTLGLNVLRVWPYVTWPGRGWDSPDPPTVLAFLERCAAAGFCVELTLLTDDDVARIGPAVALVSALAAARPTNVVLEIGNEPKTHKNIQTQALRGACEASGLLFASGDNETSEGRFGTYLTAHTPRDSEWPRKAHDLKEYFEGGGPRAATDPAHHMPCVADEPIRPDEAGYWAPDFYAYALVCSLLGAGATFHYERGKDGQLPNELEAGCAEAFARGLSALPADAPLGIYRRLDEHGASLRTYVVGPYMVRVRPVARDAPETGWISRDDAGVLWTLA